MVCLNAHTELIVGLVESELPPGSLVGSFACTVKGVTVGTGSTCEKPLDAPANSAMFYKRIHTRYI